MGRVPSSLGTRSGSGERGEEGDDRAMDTMVAVGGVRCVARARRRGRRRCSRSMARSAATPYRTCSPSWAVGCYAVVGGLVAARLPANSCGWLLLTIGLGLVVTMGLEVGSTLAPAVERHRVVRVEGLLNSWILIPTTWLGIRGVPPRSPLGVDAVAGDGADRFGRRAISARRGLCDRPQGSRGRVSSSRIPGRSTVSSVLWCSGSFHWRSGWR